MAEQYKAGMNFIPSNFERDTNTQTPGLEWEYSRNAINTSERDNRYILSNEPSNYLCCEVIIDNKPATIVGMIYLFDDKWCVFSTLNKEPSANPDFSEIGIFDKSQCCYVPVVRSKCLNLSEVYPVRGVSRLSFRQNYMVYFGDGYNPDRVIDLGNFNLWPTCKDNRGDVRLVPWLNDLINIPYLTNDRDPSTSCYEPTPILPLELDCNALSLSPKISIPCVTVKQSRLQGTLPNGLYSVAIAYSVGGNYYGNWFHSDIAHVYSRYGESNNAIEIQVSGIDERKSVFNHFLVAVIKHVNGQVTSHIVGEYDIKTKKISISYIDESTAIPISLDELLSSKLIIEKSSLLQKAGDHLVRIAPYSKFDFNYQPLANLIETRWFVAEYPERYYYDLKNSSISANIESDVVGYLRDEVYTFFIRWVYDDGSFSSFYHIPGPPYNTSNCKDDVKYCNNDLGEQENNAIFSSVVSGISAQDNGSVIAEGFVGSFISSEKYDAYQPFRWNWTHFRDNVIKKQNRALYSLPYGSSDASCFDLCGKNIRLHRMPDESLHPSLYLYNKPSGKIRMLGVYFTNIYHPLDNDGNEIQGIVGFEIWRADRNANRTIIAKGVLNRANGYNYRNENNSNNPSKHNAIFETYPCGDNTTLDHPYLGVFKINPFNFVSSSFSVTMSYDMSLRDTWDKVAVNRYKHFTNLRPKVGYFHSPETTLGYPYLNANYIKYIGEVYSDDALMEYFVNNVNIPKTRLLSPTEIGMLLTRALVGGFRVLNGDIEIRFGGHDSNVNSPVGDGADLWTGGATSAASLAVKQYILPALGVFAQTLLPNLPLVLAGLNASGYTAGEVVDMYTGLSDSVYLFGSIVSTLNYKSPTIIKKNDGLLDAIPKDMKVKMLLPLYMLAFNEVFHNYRKISEQTKPLLDYGLTGVLKAELHDFYAYSSKCSLNEIDSSYYLLPYVYNMRMDGGSYHVNHRYRTQCVISTFKSPILGKQKNDNTLNTRIFKNCCGETINDNTNSNPDVITRCKISRKASLQYVSYKVSNRSPYGQLYGLLKVKVGCYTNISRQRDIQANNPVKKYTSRYYFGGDTYVVRYTEKDKFLYFNNLPVKMPDGFEFNYLGHRNILYPRFWINTMSLSLYETYLSQMNTTIVVGGISGSIANYIYCGDIGASCKERVKSFIGSMLLFGYDFTACASSIEATCKIKEGIDAVISLINGFFSGIQSFLSNVIGFLSGIASGVCDNIPSCDNILSCLAAIVLGIICLVVGIVFFVLIISIFVVQIALGLLNMLVTAVLNMGNVISTLPLLQNTAICILNNSTSRISQLLANAAINYNMDGCTGIKCRPNSSYVKNYLLETLQDLWIYFMHGTVRDFFVESSYNTVYRTDDPTTGIQYYNPYGNTDILQHFAIERYMDSDVFRYDKSMYLPSFAAIFSTKQDIQPRDYNPIDAEKAYVHDKRLVVYSLAQVNPLLHKDNWRVYLPLNFKYFQDIVTNMQAIGSNGVIVLFRHSAPQYFAGTEQLQFDTGRSIVIGTGGLFNQALQAASNADPEYQYGSMEFIYSIANTPYGLFYISNNTRKVFRYAGSSLDEISNRGMRLWFNWYGGSYVKESVEGLNYFDNPIVGIGSLVTFDNKTGIVYFIKRDLEIKPEFSGLRFKYYPVLIGTNGALVNTHVILVTDQSQGPNVPWWNEHVVDIVKIYDFKSSKYVNDISWTLSYDPMIDGFVSFHDWHPNLAEGSNSTFITVVDNQIWVHNERCDSFCQFYGKGYNFELELVDSNPSNQVTISRSTEYYMECYRFFDDCTKMFHKLDYNFNKMVVYNSEQCSGLLNLIMTPKNNPMAHLQYPKPVGLSIDVLYEKVEQKYRVNGYYDIVKDRGEYSGAEQPFLQYLNDGYRRNILNNALDYNKPVTERKRFRHWYINKWLIREPHPDTNDIPYKMIVYLILDKKALSAR